MRLEVKHELTVTKYLNADEVFYKRQDEKRWRGPGRVIGQDGSKVLIKVPTGLISVHSCRVILTSEAEQRRLQGDAKEFQTADDENEKVTSHSEIDGQLQEG